MYYLGIDIGGTKCAALLAKAEGDQVSFLNKYKINTEGTYQDILEKIAGLLRKLISEHGLESTDIEAIGISCGGPLDSKKGIILSPPNLPGWDHVEIVKYFEDHLGIRTKLQNDADACGLAEWMYGAGKGSQNVIFLTFGTGFGSGLILSGKLHTGASGMAGEIGHLRVTDHGPVGYGKAGSLEGFCSGGGIAQVGRTVALEKIQQGKPVGFCKGLEELELLTAKSIGDAAEAGDPDAKRVYEISGEMLGRGLSILTDLLNPEVIVIGSIFARSRDLLWDSCNEVMKRECLEKSYQAVRVVPAALGEQIGDYATVVCAVYEG